jgi:hypothetical protein
MEREYIIRVLRETGGVISTAQPPDIAHKLHMPFRDTSEPPATATGRAP